MAPLFVLMEYMFSIGYRPEFQKEMQKRVDIAIAEYKAKESAKNK